jgi:hypothetical protein
LNGWELIDTCPACNSRAIRKEKEVSTVPQFELELFGIPLSGTAMVTYCMCLDCGLIFHNPRMTQETLAKFYGDAYRQIYPEGNEEVERSQRLCHALKDAKVEFDTHLDIGGANGAFVSLTRKEFGAESLGVDFFTRDRAVGKYDLVSSIHCLEHVLDPVAELAFIAEHAARYVLIEVPPVGCTGALAHPLEFKPWTLRGLIQSHFEILVFLETKRYTLVLAQVKG